MLFVIIDVLFPYEEVQPLLFFILIAVLLYNMVLGLTISLPNVFLESLLLLHQEFFAFLMFDVIVNSLI